jgi:DNA-binding response OmpR family regulator
MTPVPARIVVADDSDTILQMIVLALQREGYEPVTATDGREALDAINEHRPELVIVDAMMPHADGYEVARTVRDELGGDKPYVIMLTASDRQVDRDRAAEAGVDEFMSKPFSPGALRRRVRELLDGQ